MTISLNEFYVLLVFIPFFLVGIGGVFAANTGFFQTEVIKQLDPKERFYLDKLLGNKSSFFLILTLIGIVAYSFYITLPLQDSFIIITIWLSIVCLRWTHNYFKKLQDFVWKEYANHQGYNPNTNHQGYNPNANKYYKFPSKFRIKYPTPDIDEEILKTEKPCGRDSEMIFCYKLFHSKSYSDKVSNWNVFRNTIKENGWGRKRKLLLSTSKKFSDEKTYKDWEKNWSIQNLNPDIVWDDLKKDKDFNEFAQKWHFYAILISRGTIGKLNKWIFHPAIHIILIGVIGYLYYCTINNSAFDMKLGANLMLSSILFGISILFSFLYSIIALMLFIYGKVITIDDFNLPMPKLGEPFFVETSRVAVVLSISTAITVGLGIPLSLSLNFSSGISIIGAILAGLITAFIFVLSVWGTHFSMENTKARVLEKLFNQIINEKDAHKMEIIMLKYDEVKEVPIWPINIIVYINILAALIFPIILEKIFDSITL